jgi:hypothetical protein
VLTTSIKLEVMSDKLAQTKRAVKKFFWFFWGGCFLSQGRFPSRPHDIGDWQLKIAD